MDAGQTHSEEVLTQRKILWGTYHQAGPLFNVADRIIMWAATVVVVTASG